MSSLNRRDFLGGSAAVALGAGMGTASAAVSTSQVSPNEKIHVGLIGCGGMGRGDLRDFLRLDEVECLAVADVDSRHTQAVIKMVVESRGIPPAGYQDFRHILDRPDIDAVIISTPDFHHAQIAFRLIIIKRHLKIVHKG